MQDEDDVKPTYTWEYGIKQPWETVEEDEYGYLSTFDSTREYERDQKRAKKSREERLASTACVL